MSQPVLEAARVLREALAGFDPALLSGADCARAAEELAATEKACGAARALAATLRPCSNVLSSPGEGGAI